MASSAAGISFLKDQVVIGNRAHLGWRWMDEDLVRLNMVK